MPQFFSGQSPIFSQQMNDPREGLAQALIQGGTQATPVHHPLEGLGRLASALSGAYIARKQREEQEERRKQTASALSQAIANVNKPEETITNAMPAPGGGEVVASFADFNPGSTGMANAVERELAPGEKMTRLAQEISGVMPAEAANIVLAQTQAEADAQRKAAESAAARKDKEVRVLSPQETAAMGVDPKIYKVEIDAFGNPTFNKISDALSPTALQQKMDIAAKGANRTNINTEDKSPVNKRLLGLLDDNDEIGQRVQRLTSIQQLSENAPTGLGAEFKAWGTRVADALGFDVDMEEVKTLEQFRVAQMDFVMDRIAGTKGAISEKEMRAFEQAGPNIANTPEGNVIISKVMRAQLEREYALNEIEAEALETTGSVLEARRARSEKRKEFMNTPVLADEELAMIGQATPTNNDPLGIR